jgi:beta-lactamase superfamily II metal-dependent hydrolase
MARVDRPRTKKPPKKKKPVAGFDVKAPPTGITSGRPSRSDQRKLEEQRKKDSADRALASAEADRTTAVTSNRPVGPAAGERGDGSFHISFIKMGQGDCTIMSTPQGQVILIDCGTNDDEGEEGYAERVKAELNSVAYLRNTKTIDIVILSHADKDHYNQLETMLADDYKALTIYHSAEIGDYHSGAKWAHKHILDEALIKKVVLTKDATRGENTLAGRAILPIIGGTNGLEKLDKDDGFVIVSEPNCVITLLASSVSYAYVQDGDAQDKRNRGSVVTLVETFGKKILISADATRATEEFLLESANRATRLQNVDIVQAGHHGSNVTSTGQGWVDHLCPAEKVIISAGVFGRPNHYLPSAAVVARYVQRFQASAHPADIMTHPVSAWDTTEDTLEPALYEVDQPVYTTGSSDTQIITIP